MHLPTSSPAHIHPHARPPTHSPTHPWKAPQLSTTWRASMVSGPMPPLTIFSRSCSREPVEVHNVLTKEPSRARRVEQLLPC